MFPNSMLWPTVFFPHLTHRATESLSMALSIQWKDAEISMAKWHFQSKSALHARFLAHCPIWWHCLFSRFACEKLMSNLLCCFSTNRKLNVSFSLWVHYFEMYAAVNYGYVGTELTATPYHRARPHFKRRCWLCLSAVWAIVYGLFTPSKACSRHALKAYWSVVNIGCGHSISIWILVNLANGHICC